MKKKIDYTITIIYFYRFVCNDPNIINMYVGSTVDMTKRKTNHKTKCNNPNDKAYNYSVYKTIRDNGGWDNWRMLEIENKIVKDKTEAKQQEQYWIEYFNAQMNMIKASYNQREYQREYYEQNKEQINAYQLEYKEKNKEQIIEYKRDYYKQNKEQLNARTRDYYKQNKEQLNAYHLEHYEQNKEQRKAYQREYREKNKEQINAKKRENCLRKKEQKTLMETKNI